MESFALIMAAILALGTYKVPEVNKDYLLKANPQQRVEVFHKTCQSLMNMSAFKEEGENINFDVIVGFAADILKTKDKQEITPTTTASDYRFYQLAKIIAPEKLIGFYTDVCREAKPEAYEKYDLAEAVNLFVKTVDELPSVDALDKALPQTIYIQDRDGNKISEVYKPENRRSWVDYKYIPQHVINAFVATEDKRFFQHNGVDENGLVRAFLKSMSGSLQGGSSITQQLTKNLFFKADVEKEKETGDIKLTILRKIKELLQTRKIETKYSKAQIIQYYLNLIYLGRNSWGVRTASHNYFGRELNQLTLSEIAFLAALPKGPNNYEPAIYMNRALERRNLVLNRMAEAKLANGKPFISEEEKRTALNNKLDFVQPTTPNNAPYFVDHLKGEIGADQWIKGSVFIKSTIQSQVQVDTEIALGEALNNFELAHGLQKWLGPLSNISKYLSQKGPAGEELSWQDVFKIRSQKFANTRLGIGVIIDEQKKIVGLLDGQELRLDQRSLKLTKNSLKYGDIIYVKPVEQGFAQVINVPKIQGAAIAMDINSGDVIAMTGGFSHATNPFNRATKAFTQPGSALKPFFYLGALQNQYQPNVMVANTQTYLPGKSGCKPWGPQNYGGEESRFETLRYCLEHSKNLCVANMMSNHSAGPEPLFQSFRSLMEELEVYKDPSQCYPLVLGAQATTVYRLARAYATIANGGYLVKPRFYTTNSTIPGFENAVVRNKIQSVDEVSLAQMRSLLQGVIGRGTGSSMKKYAKIMGGKTGTSQSSKSTWFAGFSNDVVVVVYIAYDDNRSMGEKATGGDIALPVVAKIFESTFSNYKKPVEINSTVAGTVNRLVDYRSGELISRPSGDGVSINEIFRANVKIESAPVLTKKEQPANSDGANFFDKMMSDGPELPKAQSRVSEVPFDDFFENQNRRQAPAPRSRRNDDFKPWWDERDRGSFEEDPFFEKVFRM